MEYKIVLANYCLALSAHGTHPFQKRLECALKGLLLSFLGVYVCTKNGTTRFRLGQELRKLAVFYVFLDTSFYWLHRLLHVAAFYKHHKLHHLAVHTKPSDAIVASTVEMFLTGTVPFFGAVWLVKPHRRTFQGLLVLAMPFLLFAHSKWDNEHHAHHLLQNCNFGNTRAWDYMCGTHKNATSGAQRLSKKPE